MQTNISKREKESTQEYCKAVSELSIKHMGKWDGIICPKAILIGQVVSHVTVAARICQALYWAEKQVGLAIIESAISDLEDSRDKIINGIGLNDKKGKEKANG